MTLTQLYRYLRAAHEHRHPHPYAVDNFARDTLEHIVTLFDTVKTDIEDLVQMVGPIIAKIKSVDGIESMLPEDVRAELDKLHTLAESVRGALAATPPAQAPTEAPVADAPAPEVAPDAPAGTLTADVQATETAAPEAPDA